uniref:Peroxin-7 n=1 Tax=Euplotes harpa TaxID=151035 RepID=A0A7S3NFZ7_9SPIT|mmetsp:Transcript_4193/g.5109  ORF Transcript_4193/g.5109 Transcript_4193/m.5109 type:complete len:102 (+) Transcript_4193:410-715(+)
MTSLYTFKHAFVAYQAVWHPTHESIVASCSGDETFRIWDLRTGSDVKAVKAHDNEILTLDFNKYENYIATGSTDTTIKIWDLRATLDEPLMTLPGHILAVK